MEENRTVRATESGGRPAATEATLLIRIGRSDAPLSPDPRIVDLTGVRLARLGRAEVQGQEAVRGELDLGLADSWMSSRHAHITREAAGRYVLEDQQSTNGCLINGARVARQELRHGDIVETGRLFWKFHQETLRDRAAIQEMAYSGGKILPTSSVCPSLLDQLGRLLAVAPTRIPLILLGESSTGKEVMTSIIHDLSGRSGQFVALNCGSIPEGLMESELFGHRKGAFTGAVDNKRGLVEEADQGTLLLDEIGDMPPAAQVKVLRLLQERTFTRLGETTVRDADVRFVAATHRDLHKMVEQETFRGDLFARLNGFTVQLPALRQRKEDMGLLLAVFLQRHGGPRPPALDHEAFRALLLYSWPFNIRELDKAVETAVALSAAEGGIALPHLPDAVQTSPAPDEAAPPSPERGRFKRTGDHELRPVLEQFLAEHKGNVSAVARDMGHARKQIHRWMKRLGIDPSTYR